VLTASDSGKWRVVFTVSEVIAGAVASRTFQTAVTDLYEYTEAHDNGPGVTGGAVTTHVNGGAVTSFSPTCTPDSGQTIFFRVRNQGTNTSTNGALITATAYATGGEPTIAYQEGYAAPTAAEIGTDIGFVVTKDVTAATHIKFTNFVNCTLKAQDGGAISDGGYEVLTEAAPATFAVTAAGAWSFDVAESTTGDGTGLGVTVRTVSGTVSSGDTAMGSFPVFLLSSIGYFNRP
jgi:hypothetical protein